MKFYFKSSLVVCSLFWFVSCKSQNVVLNKDQAKETSVNDSTFVNLKQYSQDFEYDMKYATEDNFLKAKVYDCAECFLRLKTVNALIEANKKFLEKGYKIKIFDCYRPLDIQKKMWKIVANPKIPVYFKIFFFILRVFYRNFFSSSFYQKLFN